MPGHFLTRPFAMIWLHHFFLRVNQNIPIENQNPSYFLYAKTMRASISELESYIYRTELEVHEETPFVIEGFRLWPLGEC